MSDDQDGCELSERFFWYRPTRVVPDQRPLNGCVCVCVRACVSSQFNQHYLQGGSQWLLGITEVDKLNSNYKGAVVMRSVFTNTVKYFTLLTSALNGETVLG